MTELSDTSVTAPMEPTRNPDVTLPDLITVLLDKGTYLNRLIVKMRVVGV